MTTLFATRLLREVINDKKKILDAGCGTGVQALYLARRSPVATVTGYDVSPEAIAKAHKYQQRHGVPNAFFSVASHDDFNPPHKMDMVYTADSLMGSGDMRSTNPEEIDKIARRRLSRFREMLVPGGTYVITGGASNGANENIIHIAEQCGLSWSQVVEGNVLGYISNALDNPVRQSGIVFERV